MSEVERRLDALTAEDVVSDAWIAARRIRNTARAAEGADAAAAAADPTRAPWFRCVVDAVLEQIPIAKARYRAFACSSLRCNWFLGLFSQMYKNFNTTLLNLTYESDIF